MLHPLVLNLFVLTRLMATAAAEPTSTPVCPARSSDLLARSARIEAARAAQDQERLQSEGDALRAEVSCLTEAVSPPAAARLHFALALVAFDQQDLPAVSAGFRSARRVDPAFMPDPILMPEGGRLRSLWNEADKQAGPPIPVASGFWLLDGLPGGSTIPSGQALTIQQTQQGRVTDSYLLISGRDPLPPPLLSTTRHRSRWIATSGGAAALLGAGGLALAGWSRSEFRAEADDDRADAMDSLNRASALSGYALTALSGGLIVGAVVVGEW